MAIRMDKADFTDKATRLVEKYHVYFFLMITLLAFVGSLYMLVVYNDSLSFPTGSDEQFYYINAKSVAELGSLEATITFNGYGSLLFGADAHGYSYPLVFGVIGKAFGFTNLTIITVNAVVFIIALLMILIFVPGKFYLKIGFASMILLYPVMLYFVASFHVESFYVLFSVCTFLMIYYLNRSQITIPKLIAYFFILLCFSVFRSSWAIFSFATIPLARNKLQSRYLIMISIIITLKGFIIAFVSTEQFEIPSSLISISRNLVTGGYMDAAKQIGARFLMISDFFLGLKDFKAYGLLLGFYSLISKLIIILSIVYLWWAGKTKKDKFAFALVLPLSLFFVMNFLVYAPQMTTRIIFPAFLFAGLYMLVTQKVSYLTALILIFIACSPLSFITNSYYYNTKKNAIQHEYGDINHLSREIGKLESIVTSNSPLIFIDHASLGDLDYVDNLPIVNKRGKKMGYVLKLYGGDLNSREINYVITKRDTSAMKSHTSFKNRALRRVYHSQSFSVYDVK